MVNVSEIAQKSAAAALVIGAYSTEQKNTMLTLMADAIKTGEAAILAANAIDVRAAEGVKDKTFIDRLMLTSKRVDAMCEGVRQVAALPDPVGEVAESWTSPVNGLFIEKVRAPLGVIAIIYEARPNVTADAAALCIKSGNAVILRGSKDAINSNRAIYAAMRKALEKGGFDANSVAFIDDVDRASTGELLKQDRYVDLVIPRGGEGLKRYVTDNSKIPVIASAGGNCHVYVESSADLKMAEQIIYNAKLQRPSVCNAAESLLVDEKIAAAFLPDCLKYLDGHGVEIVGCEKTRALFPKAGIADEKEYATEYENYKISVKVVSGIDEAIEHINKYSTKHSEAIVTKDKAAAALFTRRVDSAALYINASTRFTDGFEFGFGAEMGISTGKLQARGPLGLRELTSAKYICTGNGHVRK
ncbi:MAG: glutamate-5-semialdehyde dehydrogenase [Clostridiaceae bacterium]|jgi:glutamate-5-semialdehyde dehydrogenase|nr:glutamate-5-semialdehyde dehydrogenase [Clostridiaceae bacterium]